jgi:hypothetical protein
VLLAIRLNNKVKAKRVMELLLKAHMELLVKVATERLDKYIHSNNNQLRLPQSKATKLYSLNVFKKIIWDHSILLELHN